MPFLAPNSGDNRLHVLGFYREAMVLTNLILTVVGVGTAVMLLRKDVKQSSAVFRRNIRHIKIWLEEEFAATTSAERSVPKELESQDAKKDSTPKVDKD